MRINIRESYYMHIAYTGTAVLSRPGNSVWAAFIPFRNAIHSIIKIIRNIFRERNFLYDRSLFHVPIYLRRNVCHSQLQRPPSSWEVQIDDTLPRAHSSHRPSSLSLCYCNLELVLIRATSPFDGAGRKSGASVPVSGQPIKFQLNYFNRDSNYILRQQMEIFWCVRRA